MTIFRTSSLSIVLPILLIGSIGIFKKAPSILEKKHQTEYVFVLVIDGPRYCETYGSKEQQNIPFLRDSMLTQGTFFDRFYNKGVTYTVPGHIALTTSNYQNIKNDGSDLPKRPSMFQYFLKEKGLDKEQAWVIASKGKLEILGNTKNKEFRNKYSPSTYCGIEGRGVGYSADSLTMQEVQKVMRTHPKLVLINLLEVDVMGHANNWEGYIKGIQKTDAAAWKLWQLIQNDPIYKNKTALFITNDHGRHLDKRKSGFKEHGDGCRGCRHISLLALGPDFPKGKTVHEKYELRDIAPTIARLLDFKMPTAKGEPIAELLP